VREKKNVKSAKQATVKI